MSTRPRDLAFPVVVVLFAALVAVVYANPLFLRNIFTGRDLVAYNIPMEKSVHDAWSSGELPVWTPEISGGRPLAPNPNVGSFYPVRMLLSRIPFPAALRIFPVIHWVAAGIGMLLLLSALGLSRGGAWLGAVTYVFSGVSVSECFYTHIQPGMTLLPWILWQMRRARGARGTLLLAILIALDLLAADVFTIAVALGCAALWAALEEEEAEAKRGLVRLGAALGLALLAAAPQIVATALWIPETNRGVIGMKLSNVTLYSISPWRLLELVVPYPFGPAYLLDAYELWGGPVHNYRGIGLFSTLYAGALPVIAVLTFWRVKAPGLRFARVLLVLALVVSVVPSLFPESWGSLKSPLPLRNPEKLAVAIVLALAIFAARGFDLLRVRPKTRWTLPVAILLTAAASAVWFFPEAAGQLAADAIGGYAPFPRRAAVSLPFALATAGLLWTATLVAIDLAKRRTVRGFGMGVALAILTAVPIVATRPIARTVRQESILEPTAFARRIAKEDPAGQFRTLGAEIYRTPEGPRSSRYGDGWEGARQDWIHYAPILWRRGMVFNLDFDEGDLARVESLRKISGYAAVYPEAAPFFGAFALRWCVRYPSQPPFPGYRRFGGNSAQDWDEHEHPFPDIRLATQWTEVESAIAAATGIANIAPGNVVIETGRKDQGRAAPGKLEILKKTPARLEIATETAEPTWLFVLRAFWNHRRITLDGNEAEVWPANIAFTAVRIPAGRHRIVWEERIPGWDLSRLGPLAFGMIAAGLLVLTRRNRKEP